MYKNCAVLITGHTGFKGSWLAPLLAKFGSQLCGYSLDIPTAPNHFLLQKIPIQDVRGDLADADHLRKTMQQFQPEIVFHLAAQSLVRLSFQKPAETFAANVAGTVNVLEACRQTPSVRAVLIITSDKCYKNNPAPPSEPHIETDPLGGSDPYSASKACAEIVTESYRHAFGGGHFLIASCRSGNVIGGGDWAKDRLIPDLIRSAAGAPPAILRMPEAVRPWQHVLNPICGYLQLGAKLLEGKKEFAEAWNFGPDTKENGNENLPVQQIARLLKRHWNKVRWKTEPEANCKETAVLTLDSGKARQRLGWKPVWSFSEALEKTAEWYRQFYENGTIQTEEQIEQFGAIF